MLWQIEETEKMAPDVRMLLDMKEILYDKRWLQKNVGKLKDLEIYSTYRGVCKPSDEAAIRKTGLRYDVTVIPPFMMGDEYVKTAGHYHPIAIDDLTFPEVYQVLEGEALFLIQKVDNFDRHNLIDVAFAKAKAGDVFVVPPNFGHVTINSSKKRLVIAKWGAEGVKTIHEPIGRMCGAAYFFTEDGWVRNLRYGLVPNLREIKCKPMDDIYNYVSDLKRLAFLKNPTIRPEKTELPATKNLPEQKSAPEPKMEFKAQPKAEPEANAPSEKMPEDKAQEKPGKYVPIGF